MSGFKQSAHDGDGIMAGRFAPATWALGGALVCMVAIFIFSTASAQTPFSGDPAPAPDLSSYDCNTTSEASLGVQHVGQVILGTYNEWQQFYRDNGQTHLIICINLIKPSSRALSRDQAAKFLDDARAIGVLTQEGLKSLKEHSQDTFVPPKNIIPLAPLKVVPSSDVEQTAPPEIHVPTKLTPLRPIPSTSAPSNSPNAEGNAPSVERPQSLENAEAIDAGNRARVGNVNVFPAPVIGQLVISFSNGGVYSCTGTLISAYVVLTAGHCSHNRDAGGFPIIASFAPAQNQLTDGGPITRPFGVGYATYVATNVRWSQISGGETITTINSQYDYGMFYFPSGFTYTNTFMPVLYGDSRGPIVNIGYPGIVNNVVNEGQWFSAGSEDARSISTLRGYQVREFSTTSSPGHSGGPFFYYDGVTSYLVGILSYGNTSAGFTGGAWLGGGNQALIQRWSALNPTNPPQVASGGSGPSKAGLRVPVVFASSVSGFLDFLRFGNADVTAGTVTVLISDGTSGQYLSKWVSPQIASAAELQVPMGDIERQATPPISPGTTSNYTLVVQSGFQGYFQNVLWNLASSTLSNMLGCENGLSHDTVTLMAVHTTLVPSLNSDIVVHNTGSSSATVSLYVFDARNGNYLGNFRSGTQLGPDADGIITMPEVQAAIHLTPTGDMYHLNFLLDSSFQGYIEHFVENAAFGLITNMSAKCDLE